MSFGWKPPRQNAGEPIMAASLNRTFEAVGCLLRMTVGRGLSLAWVRGAPVISLEDDYRLYNVKTTDEWPARASGSEQMGKGHFKFKRANLTGLLSDTGEPTYEGWNYTGGKVPAGVRGVVVKIDGLWQLVSADCSGVS
jgi:hypothetical protein